MRELQIEGVASVVPFHRTVVDDPAFTGEQGFGVHTRWIETEMAARFDAAARPEAEAAVPLVRTFIEIDGKRYDALSETVFVPAGTRVRVSVAEAAQVRVRPVV